MAQSPFAQKMGAQLANQNTSPATAAPGQAPTPVSQQPATAITPPPPAPVGQAGMPIPPKQSLAPRPAGMATPGGLQPSQGALAAGMANAPQPGSQPTMIDDLYGDLMKQHEESWANKQQLAEQQARGYNRRAMAMSGAAGRGLGGGFAQAMGQARLQGMQQMLAARTGHDQTGLGIKKDWAQSMMGADERQKDRQHQLDMHGLANPDPADAGGGIGNQEIFTGGGFSGVTGIKNKFTKEDIHNDTSYQSALSNSKAVSNYAHEYNGSTLSWARSEGLDADQIDQLINEYVYDYWKRENGSWPTNEMIDAHMKRVIPETKNAQ